MWRVRGRERDLFGERVVIGGEVFVWAAVL